MAPLRAFAVAVLALLTVALAQQPGKGTCILAGGGKLPKEIPARFVELAGGKNARIVLIPTASESADDPTEHDSLQKLWREERGAEITIFHTRDRAKADDEAFCAPLRAATGVWFGGGTQKRIADAYLGTRVETELMALLARGGVIAGTSAGTAIQTRTMIQEGMEDPIVATGFDFVPGVVSDQHFLKRQRLPRLLKVLGQHPGLFGIGVDESTAAEIRGDTLRVIGASKAVLVLAAQNGHDDVVREIEPFAAEDAAIDIGAWRRAAKERATWSLLHPGTSRIEKGTLLLGDGDGVRERFLTLAERTANTVVLGASHEEVLATQNLLHLEGATDIVGKVLGATPDWLASVEKASRVVITGNASPEWSAILDSETRELLATALRAVLARGGIVWGGELLGEVIVNERRPGLGSPAAAYERGLAVLPGTVIATRHPRSIASGKTPADSPDGTNLRDPLTSGAARLPRFVGLSVPGAAIVRDSWIEVLDQRVRVRPALAEAEPGREREAITLEPGTKWDLVAQKKL